MRTVQNYLHSKLAESKNFAGPPRGGPAIYRVKDSAKSLVLKMSAHMRALTASKDQYKLKSPQHVCGNLNIFVTVVP